MRSLKWRWFRMGMMRRMMQICPSRWRVRLFDLLEAVHYLDIDHMEDVANDFSEFYEEEVSPS